MFQIRFYSRVNLKQENILKRSQLYMFSYTLSLKLSNCKTCTSRRFAGMFTVNLQKCKLVLYSKSQHHMGRWVHGDQTQHSIALLDTEYTPHSSSPLWSFHSNHWGMAEGLCCPWDRSDPERVKSGCWVRAGLRPVPPVQPGTTEK